MRYLRNPRNPNEFYEIKRVIRMDELNELIAKTRQAYEHSVIPDSDVSMYPEWLREGASQTIGELGEGKERLRIELDELEQLKSKLMGLPQEVEP